ncbi:MAG: ATP-grasp domain-containing protein [Deltaproteobacteria bacterium]|nr:ATP-grasp domain-containing protein [Deltaproteobacteria bacterium]
MPHIALVAPLFLENTNRYVAAFAALEGVTLSVISQDPSRAIPESLKPHIAGHFQVRDVGDASELARALGGLRQGIGPIDRLTGFLEQLQVPMAKARELAEVPGMRVAAARRFRDKDVMKEVLREHGVPVAASRLVSSMEELRAFVDAVGFPVIVKPQAGLGSRGTHRIESQGDLDALARLGLEPRQGHPLQAEQFIRAREFTCETVTIHGEPVWRSGTRYFPTPLEVLETPWKQYCVLLPREVEAPWTDFAPVNGAALDALFGDEKEVAGTALSHMEWFYAEGGKMFVSEVGVRPPGVHIMPLMSLAHDVDMVAKWAELIAFDRFTPVERRCAAGAAFFRGQGGGARVVEVHGLEEAVAKVGPALVELRAPKVGQLRATGYEGEGSAIVKSESTEAVKAALLALVETVQVRYG